jgi:hypothetical protein
MDHRGQESPNKQSARYRAEREHYKSLLEKAEADIEELKQLIAGKEAEIQSIHSRGRTSPTTSSLTHRATVNWPKFSKVGDDVDGFIIQAEICFELTGLTDSAKKIAVVGSQCFSGDAQAWFVAETVRAGSVEQALTANWDDFKLALKRHFQPHDQQELVRERLRLLRQDGSITKFVNEFNALNMTLRDTTDVDRRFMFTSKLESGARSNVLLARPKSLAEAMAAALLYESAHSSTTSTVESSASAAVNNVSATVSGQTTCKSDEQLSLNQITDVALNVARSEIAKFRGGWQGNAKVSKYYSPQRPNFNPKASGGWSSKKPALSFEDRERYMQQRLCFNCGMPNHRAAECRTR